MLPYPKSLKGLDVKLREGLPLLGIVEFEIEAWKRISSHDHTHGEQIVEEDSGISYFQVHCKYLE